MGSPLIGLGLLCGYKFQTCILGLLCRILDFLISPIVQASYYSRKLTCQRCQQNLDRKPYHRFVVDDTSLPFPLFSFPNLVSLQLDDKGNHAEPQSPFTTISTFSAKPYKLPPLPLTMKITSLVAFTSTVSSNTSLYIYFCSCHHYLLPL